MLFKKTLVLCSVDGGNQKAVVNFENEGNCIVGEIKLYNFDDEPSGILSLGLKAGENVYKAGLTRIGYLKYNFSFNNIFSFDEFSCAIININRGEVSALVSGSTINTKLAEEVLAKAVLDIDNAKTMEEVKEVLDDNDIELEDQAEIEKEIDNAMEKGCGEKCSCCKYRHAFFSGESEEKKETFFDSIEEDINKLFMVNKEEEILSQIIPYSKWVKIDNEDSDQYYVLGLIYENDEVKYICYGVPAMYSNEPPKELKGCAEWLPIDSTKENEFGYWITYQDAENGDNVKANFTVI